MEILNDKSHIEFVFERIHLKGYLGFDDFMEIYSCIPHDKLDTFFEVLRNSIYVQGLSNSETFKIFKERLNQRDVIFEKFEQEMSRYLACYAK